MVKLLNGCRVSGIGYRGSGQGSVVIGVSGIRYRVSGSGVRGQWSVVIGHWVLGVGCRVSGIGILDCYANFGRIDAKWIGVPCPMPQAPCPMLF